jgi:hypothetical protein
MLKPRASQENSKEVWRKGSSGGILMFGSCFERFDPKSIFDKVASKLTSDLVCKIRLLFNQQVYRRPWQKG